MILPHSSYAAVEIASTVKMVQNVLIGPVAIAVTIYWIAYALPTIRVDGKVQTWLTKIVDIDAPLFCH